MDLSEVAGHVPLAAYLAAVRALRNGARVGRVSFYKGSLTCVELDGVRHDSVRALRHAGWFVSDPDRPGACAPWAVWPATVLPF